MRERNDPLDFGCEVLIKIDANLHVTLPSSGGQG